jgi:zinc protease
VFGGIKDKITPALILASTKKLFEGTPPRAMLISPMPVVDGNAKLLKALTDPVAALATNNGGAKVTFADLPPLGKPGRVVKRTTMARLGIEQIEFANGVRMLMYPNEGEAGKIYVNVRFGRGLQALPRDRQTPAWAGSGALLAGGVGSLDQNALDRLTSGRKIGTNFDIGDNAFGLGGQTRPVDLVDQLKLMAAMITSPRWDDAPVLRARASFLTGYDTLDSGPQSVLSRDLTTLLHGGDMRWKTPSRAEIEGLTPKAFEKFWAPLLKTGPIEVRVFGDVQTDTAITAVAQTFGAIKKRRIGRILHGSESSASAQPTPETIIRTHKGDPDQAAAVMAWPTGGGLDTIYEARKLEVISQIFNDRLFDQLRGAEGASYSPQANSQWPNGLDGGGNFIVISQLQPDKLDLFYKVVRSIAADLAAKPVSADELERTIKPIQELISRVATGNTFWSSQLAGATQDERRVTALRTLISDYQRITPAELQAAAARWFVPSKEFRFAVLPEKTSAPPK